MKQPQGTVSGKWRLRRQCGGTQRCGCWEVAESEEGAQIAHVRGKAAAAQGLSEGDRTRMQGSWGKGITAFEGKKAAESTGNTGPELTLGASLQSRESYGMSCSMLLPLLSPKPAPCKSLPACLQLALFGLFLLTQERSLCRDSPSGLCFHEHVFFWLWLHVTVSVNTEFSVAT